MSDWLIETQQLTVAFDGFRALDNLDFRVRRGEVRVVIGPNGAGKTTLLDVISGKVAPTTGKVLFNGRSIGGLAENRIAHLGIGRKFQTPRIFSQLTVRENIELCARHAKTVLGVLSDRRLRDTTVDDVLALVNLGDKAEQRAGTLSHGEKQWLEIGMVVAQDPVLLLVDEPVAGMTDRETEKTSKLLRDLGATHTIIVIEHDMEFVRGLAQTVTVLHEGRLLCEGSVTQVQSNPRVAEVYLGRHALEAAH
ncbi:MAG TPA: urea ABC transporter ATP-binding protein UrtD [Candidatus Acidoferrales bacterium]|nr:urea ABC transporter ATP-binding protein UrtD [Candidatus Acidoferrales bacterium]